MRYFILIFKSYELTCCRTCFRGLAPGAVEELCCHFSSQRKPCFISGALKALWTAKCGRDPALARKVAMSVTRTSDVFGTKPTSTDMLVLMASSVSCPAREVMGNWRLNMLVETQGKPEASTFPEYCYPLQVLLSLYVLLSCLLYILWQSHWPLLCWSSGLQWGGKELREVVIWFKTLVHEEFVWWAIVSISYCSGIRVRYQS